MVSMNFMNIQLKGIQSGIVKLLLEHKCDPKLVKEDGNSALFVASAKEYTEIVLTFARTQL